MPIFTYVYVADTLRHSRCSEWVIDEAGRAIQARQCVQVTATCVLVYGIAVFVHDIYVVCETCSFSSRTGTLRKSEDLVRMVAAAAYPPFTRNQLHWIFFLHAKE